MKAFIFLVAALLCISTGAHAQGPVYGKPIYNPASKSYFELVKVTSAMSPGSASPALPQDKAAAWAAGRNFKGAKGRLAIVRDFDTHMFLLENLRPNEAAWIGLKYLCKTRELVWSNGEKLTRGQFSIWDQQWNHSGVAGCVNGGGETDWMPVAYSPANTGFRWFAIGGKKIYVAFIVEYPTGAP